MLESCDPSLAANSAADPCGIFVSSSIGVDASQGDATKIRPYATIAKALVALSAATGNPIDLCGETFDVSVALPVGLRL